MHNNAEKNFGNLITSGKTQYFSNSFELNCLFNNTNKKLDNFKIMEAEREVKMQNLRALTHLLQSKSKRIKDFSN